MKIAIISDIHENKQNLLQALDIADTHDVKALFCLGDLVNPGIAKTILSFSKPIYAVRGDNDGKKVAITKEFCKHNDAEIANDCYMFFTYADRKIALTHYTDLGEVLAKSGEFDAVFCGHDHIYAQQKLTNACLLANPGELSTHKTGIASFLIWNTESNTAEHILLENYHNNKW